MNIDDGYLQDVLVLTLTGRLNQLGSSQLSEVVEAALEDGPRDLAIDMGHVVYIGHSGVRTLVKYVRNVRSQDRRMILVAVPVLVFDMFEFNGLGGEFEFAANMEHALKLLRPN